MRKKLIIGNWKMNGDIGLIDEFTDAFAAESMIFGLPSIFISYAKSKNKNLKIAAQDCSIFNGFGAHTGEVSCEMLMKVGVQYVILGHSERRAPAFDSIDNVFKKLSNALETGLTAIFCVDEKHENLIDEKTAKLIEKNAESVIIAYEPVTAIGTGFSMSIDEICRNVSCIKTKYNNPRTVYGGSVNSRNAADILAIREVDGVLVGGASLKIDEMRAIVGN